MRWKLIVSALAGGAMLATGAVALAAAFSPGSPGLGDPYFPLGGNGGYDVQRYGLTLAYDPPANALSGTAVITAKATQALSQGRSPSRSAIKDADRRHGSRPVDRGLGADR